MAANKKLHLPENPDTELQQDLTKHPVYSNLKRKVTATALAWHHLSITTVAML